MWTTGIDVIRTYSNDLGASWATAATFPGGVGNWIDPITACNIFGSQSPRHMYFGWYAQAGVDPGDRFNRSISDGNVDNTVVAQAQGVGITPDRPWLCCNTASLYLSYSNVAGTDPLPYVKRAAMPSGTGTISWTASAVQVASPLTGTAFVGSFPMATYVDSNGAESAYVITQQYTEEFPPLSVNKNVMRIYKSTNAGSSWSSDILGINVDSADGYVKTRDYPMLTYHVSKDPNPSSGKLYAFYVRNEVPAFLTGPPHNALYCKSSYNGGTTWNGERRVYTIPSTDLPANGFAEVPANSDGSTAGFFRIGRVWSCVDPSGNVYVAWMDNRYGKYGSTDKDYWHVFYSKSADFGDTWSTALRVSGTSNATASASIGGGQPPRGDWVPPGDFLTCDADSVKLYVAWPDNRGDQGGSPGTHAYINAIAQ